MHFQWYPGHMSKARRQMQEDVALIDVVIELVDARIPYSSKNPDIDRIAKNKSRIILMNKYDLADTSVSDQWRAYYESKGWFVTNVNSKAGSGVRNVHEVIQRACKEKMERDRARGILNRPIRAMIVGIPNVGKSTFINSFVGKASAKTGNKPGVTKGKQWIRLNKDVELLDTPGILWPKFEDQRVGMRIAFIGSINDDILVPTDLAYELCKYILKSYPGVLSKKYEIEEDEDVVITLEHIAKKRGCLLKGGEFDLNKAAVFIIDDFRSGKMGRITLETPTMIKEEEYQRSLEDKKPIKRAAEKKAEAKELAAKKREERELTRQSRTGVTRTKTSERTKKFTSDSKDNRYKKSDGVPQDDRFKKTDGSTNDNRNKKPAGISNDNRNKKPAGNTNDNRNKKPAAGARNEDRYKKSARTSNEDRFTKSTSTSNDARKPVGSIRNTKSSSGTGYNSSKGFSKSTNTDRGSNKRGR